MKKLSTTVTVKSGETKTISVWIEDDETTKLLEKCEDKEFVHRYIVEEYKKFLVERKETRRHQSLESSVDNGWDIADESVNIEEKCYKDELLSRLEKALAVLEPNQRWLIEQVYFKERTQREIAAELGVDHTSIRDRLNTIYKKIKKLL